jgi:hypothetical protein
VNGNVLVTNKGRNEFRYLIDCSGISYFLRDQLNLPKPFRYWSAKIIIMKNSKYPKEFCYHSFDDEGGFEEICVISDRIVYARWFYSGKLDKTRFKQCENSFYDLCLRDQEVISRSYCTYPVSFVLPLVYRNYAFLGDSFGNAPPLSGFGLKAILNSSKLLASAIMKENLRLFEKDWRKEYFSLYLKQLASKIERSNNQGILAKIKNYPNYRDLMEFMLKKHSGFLLKAFKDEPNLEIPRDMRNLFPKRQFLFIAATYLMLRIRYLFHDLRRFWS